MKSTQFETLNLTKIVNGGQALGTLADGRKAFVWGGLPGETVTVRVTKKKASFIEGIVTEVIEPSPDRTAPKDPDSYLSTSPWQIMDFKAEQNYKAQLIAEAFELHHIKLPSQPTIYTNGVEYGYRNKAEFSWYGQQLPSGTEQLDLAFFKRGSKGKVTITDCAIMPASIMRLAKQIRDLLQTKGVAARSLKTLLIRSNQAGGCAWQLYVKEPAFDYISEQDAANLNTQGGEVIYSDPKSPASRITKRLYAFGSTTLSDSVLGVNFLYATEGFFQINLPVYEQALQDMRKWIEGEEGRERARNGKPISTKNKLGLARGIAPLRAENALAADGDDASGEFKTTILDLYSGVGSIGLTIGGNAPELVEVNEHAVREMRRNIAALGSKAKAILAASENALSYITSDKTIIVDPPRAGLHTAVISRLLSAIPGRIIYLSCNPVTQARDISLLLGKYKIVYQQGYNFFPRTPHIENLIVLDLQPNTLPERAIVKAYG